MCLCEIVWAWFVSFFIQHNFESLAGVNMCLQSRVSRERKMQVCGKAEKGRSIISLAFYQANRIDNGKLCVEAFYTMVMAQ